MTPADLTRQSPTPKSPTAAEHQSLYRALQSRDRRFEGRFIAAITSTHIYCRPGCPARLPRPENVRFYACAAAAEEAGFRPCLRCRPDASALLPAAAGTSATVSRALQLLAEGLPEGGLVPLAERLGIGPRHLRRLFLRHLGASPRAVVRTFRLHFARQLLEQTQLPMTELALAAGFTSTRRFNDEIRRNFRTTPGELRGSGQTEGGGVSLRVPYRPPLAWDAMLGFLAARAIPGVESVAGGVYSRTVLLGGKPAVLSVRPAPGSALSGSEMRPHPGRPRRAPLYGTGAPALLVTASLHEPRALPQAVAGVRRLFDLGGDSGAISALLEKDALLAPALRAHPGLRVPGAWDPFELAVRAVLGQQVSVRGATTLAGRLVAALGSPLPAQGSPLSAEGSPLPAQSSLTHLFPTAQKMAGSDLAGLGLTGARAATLRTLAQEVASGALDFGALREQGLVAAVERLCQLPGIGAWTAQYIAMRALAEPDAFPEGDLILRRRAAGSAAEPLSHRELIARAEAWRPFRATAALALWLGGPATEA